MNNFELHEQATVLSDTHSSYELARKLLLCGQSRDVLSEQNSRLREALSQSQQIMNTLGLIMLDDKYSKAEKVVRINSMIDIHMNDIFTSNKELLAELKGE